ncbi:hypothetical protein LTR53_008292 [Teratosphaeriaceae sp. CCFEE 6253]|nr:hypothetical protein LTR53_008292 [Teratosphaeriaceae sp. CCFEE 6253]
MSQQNGWHDTQTFPEPSFVLPLLLTPARSGIVVFSGGTAANSLVDVFDGVREASHSTLSYVIPVSDNGGSSSELIRVFGGPGIGDIRSRLVRLIPEDGEEATAVKHFFNYRLPKDYGPARSEWLDILESNHSLWTGISSPKKELVRSILNSINVEMLKRLRPTSRFDFSGASIGNLFLTGARLFTGSFEAAIYLLSSVCGVPSNVAVLPVINTNFAHHIAAGLVDGTVITGQNNISHPSAPTNAVPGEQPLSPGRRIWKEADENEDANGPGTLPSLRKPALAVSKDDEEDLPTRIERLWYINPYGQQITIPANPRVLHTLNHASCIIYSIGSLFTSIIPALVLRGVGEAVASPLIKSKILILNGTSDRETGPSSHPMTALDFVAAIANACCESRDLPRPSMDSYWQYVTHVVYLDTASSPQVDKDAFNAAGVETMRLYGRKDGRGKGGRYDAKALGQGLEVICGRKDLKGDKTRRNTLVGTQRARALFVQGQQLAMTSKPYNVAIVGYGMSAKVFHIPLVQALPSDFKLYGIVQRSPKADDDVRKDHPDVKHWHSVDAIYSDPDVDVVVLTTVPETHHEMCKAALEAGKHVVCEKPFVPTASEADDLLDIAKRSGKLLTVYQNRRWDSDYLTLRQVMAEGVLGEIVEFEVHYDRHRPDPPPATWKTVEAPGHGSIFDLGTHKIDQVYHTFGMPAKVTGFITTQRRNPPEDGAHDSHTLILQYPARNLMVTVKAAIVSPEAEQLHFWVRGTEGSFKKFGVDVQEDQLKARMKPGDDGFGIESESAFGTVTTMTDGKPVRKTYETVSPPPTYLEFYRLFAKALKGEGEVPVQPQDARDCLRIIEAAFLSSREGRTVDL